MRSTALSILTIAILATAGFADIARPDSSPNRVEKPRKSVDTTMTIRLKQDAKEAKLIIPRSQLKQLRAELEQLDGETESTASAEGSGISRSQTIMSGLFLSLAIVVGGMWFVRSGKRPKSLAIILGLIGVGTAATLVFANAGPPPEARSITGKMFSPAMHIYKFGSGSIKLETSDERSYIELIVPDEPAATKPAE